MSEALLRAVHSDAKRQRQGGALRVGQRVTVRRTGEIGEVRSVDAATCRVLVACGGGMTWMSRLRVDLA